MRRLIEALTTLSLLSVAATLFMLNRAWDDSNKYTNSGASVDLANLVWFGVLSIMFGLLALALLILALHLRHRNTESLSTYTPRLRQPA